MVKKSKDGEDIKITKVSKKKEKTILDDHSSEGETLVEASHIPLEHEQPSDRVVDGLLFSPKKTKKKSSKDKDKDKDKEKKKSSTSSSSSVATKDTTKKKKKKESDSSIVQADDDMSLVSTKSSKSTKSTKSIKSTKSGISKSPRKKKSKSEDDDASVSSKKSKKGGDDDASVSSRRSKRGSKRDSSSKSKSKENTLSLEEHLDREYPPVTPYSTHRRTLDDDGVMDWRVENEALQAETVTLRKQLHEALALLDEARASQNQADDATQLQSDLLRYKNEIAELQCEVEEYEEAVAEKDGLIKKLTEAVDCQLDKVEYLELKLQRAEEEFCKMEDELKEMEEEIESLRTDTGNPSSSHSKNEDGLRHSNHSVTSSASLKEVADDMERRLLEDKRKRLELRETELEQREADLYDREQELLDREQEMTDREQELLNRAEAKLGAEMDKIRIKELRLNERERELLEMEDRLATQQTAQEERERNIELKVSGQEQKAYQHVEVKLEQSLGEIDFDKKDLAKAPDIQPEAIEELQSTIETLQQEKATLENEVNELKNDQGDMSELISELKERMQEYQLVITEGRENIKRAEEERHLRENELEAQHSLEIQTIQEGNNKQIQEMYEENRKLQAEFIVLQEQNDALKQSIPEEGIDPMDHAMAGLQDEIAGLREKIVEMERESKTLRDETERLHAEIEDHNTETKELESEILRLETQLQETKAATTKKMTQKDETISFMQNEMVRIMKEKSEVDRKLHEKELQLKDPKMQQNQSKNKLTPLDEDQERAKIQAFNDKLAALDTLNQELHEKLEQTRIQHELQLKEKDGRILEVQDELADLNWEIKARKEADYVTLLKDRKERKKELDTTKKDLKSAKERVADLERELEELRQNQDYLEKDVAELNKSLMARDSGDYVSGLKRQIRSLKEHNMTLERKLEIETSNNKDVIEKKDSKILSLESEIRDLKYPTQAAVRGMFSFTGRGDKVKEKGGEKIPDELKEPDNLSHEQPTREVTQSESQVASVDVRTVVPEPLPSPALPPPTPQRASSLWSAIISPFGGARRSIPAAALDSPKGKMNNIPISTPVHEDSEETKSQGTQGDLENELNMIEQEWPVKSSDKTSALDHNLSEEAHDDTKPAGSPVGELVKSQSTQEGEEYLVVDDQAKMPEENADLNEVIEQKASIFDTSENISPAESVTQINDVEEQDTHYEDLKGEPEFISNKGDDDSLETADDIDTDDDVELVKTEDAESHDESSDDIESENETSKRHGKERIVFV